METLMEVAKAIADTYDTHLPYAELLLVGGSVARGRADEDSDLELNVLWKNPPSDDDRLKPIGVHKGTLLEFYPFEENEWSESYEINGLKIEMSHYLTEYAMQTIEDVLVQYDPAIDKQWLISSIQDGIALGNEEWFHHLQQRVMCYPEGLKNVMIARFSKLSNTWNHRDALFQRGDWFVLRQAMGDVQRQMLALVYAVNGRYVEHPYFKWNSLIIKEMTRKPDGFEERLASLYTLPLQEAVRELECLWSEVEQLTRGGAYE